MRVGNHNLIADEPTSFGGNDFEPSSYAYVSVTLSACKAMTVDVRQNKEMECRKYRDTHKLF